MSKDSQQSSEDSLYEAVTNFQSRKSASQNVSEKKLNRKRRWKLVIGTMVAVELVMILMTTAWLGAMSVFTKQSDKAMIAALKAINLTFINEVKLLPDLKTEIVQLKLNLVNLSLKKDEPTPESDLQFDQFKYKLDVIEETIEKLVDMSPEKFLGIHPSRPVSSCGMLWASSPSGYYWVSSSNGSAIRVFCEFNTSCGPDNTTTSGWMRVTSLDMKLTSSQCPPSFCQIHENLQTCSRCSFSDLCVAHVYPVGVPYSRVCGRIIAYQVGSMEAYSSTQTLGYDGIRLSYGTTDTNIWTFYASNGENYSKTDTICQCINSRDTNIPPPPKSVGDNYFCDTAVAKPRSGVLYQDDPLWDGEGCGGISTCCSFNKPPWFYRELHAKVMEDIKMTVCMNFVPDREDAAIEKIDILVQ